jgi:hypothetical protein
VRGIPTDTESMLASLEEQYPARCRKAGEDELAHERYAGKVELIQELRRRLDLAAETTY